MKKLTLILAALVAAYATPTAFAQSDSYSDLYFGAGGGFAKISGFCDSGAVNGVTVVFNRCGNNSTAWRGVVGYQFNPYLGAEVEYALSNGYEVDATVGGRNLETETDYRTFGISAVARYFLSDSFSLFGRGGIHFWESETSVSDFSFDDDGTDFLIGGGIEFRPYEKFAIRLEHARYFADGGDLDATSLQLILYQE